MTCLLDQLSSFRTVDVLWIADPIGQIDIGRLRYAFARMDPSKWKDKRIAIGALPVLEFVSTLAYLDGLAQAIVLLPTEDDQPTREARMAQARVDIVLESEGLGLTKLLTQFDTTDATGTARRVVKKRPPAITTTWLLPTSGTTGKPKLIAHTFATLTRGMTNRRIGGNYTWGSLYSMRRFAGLQVFLQSWMCGTPLILNEEGAGLYDVLSRFIELRCNALSATPSMWRRLAMDPLFERLNLQQITLGGEIVDQTLLDMLTRRFSDARITHIYASTEVGVGFSVRDGRAGFPIHYLQRPPTSVAMRIDDKNHLWFASKSAHTSSTDATSAWTDSGDVVETQADRVYFLGRANGSINVGGNKVMPEEVESVIKELPNVAFVQVRARQSAMLGNLVEAAITPSLGTPMDAAFKKQVTAHCRTRLDGFKVPAFIVAAVGIPLTASGKLSRTNSE